MQHITLDLIVHPWFGINLFSKLPYGNHLEDYNVIAHVLKDHKINGEQYAHRLLNLYTNRIAQHAHNPEYHVMLIPFRRNLSFLHSLQNNAQELLGSRFKCTNSPLINNSALTLYPQFTPGSHISINAYGEQALYCVAIECYTLSDLYNNAGIKTTQRVISELCGDLPDGKKELCGDFSPHPASTFPSSKNISSQEK